MTPEQVILEGLFGWKFVDRDPRSMHKESIWAKRPTSPHTFSAADNPSGLVDVASAELSIRYGSVEKAAELAAEWLQSNGWMVGWVRIRDWDSDNVREGFTMFKEDDPDQYFDCRSLIEIIAEAVKAGWKGEVGE
jgi:hypothetical protein